MKKVRVVLSLMQLKYNCTARHPWRVTYSDVLGERYDIGRTAQNAQPDEN